MWFEHTAKAHKGYLNAYIVTQCPQVIGRNRFVTSNRRNEATPIQLGVFPAGDNYVGLLVPLRDDDLWLVSEGEFLISASQAATSLLGEPPNGNPISGVICASAGFEGLPVYSLRRRDIAMAECLVEKVPLDAGAVCWKLTDITGVVRNKRLEMDSIQKNHSSANLDQLRSFTFHEINNQLLSMRMAVNKSDLPRAGDVLSYIEESTRAIMGFASTGHNSECCLDKVIRQMMTLVKSLVQHSVELTFDGPNDLFFFGQVAAFKIYLMNVLGNAAKATQVGKIHVQLSQYKHRYSITVSDTGPGIGPEHQAKLTTPSGAAGDVIGHGQGLLIIRSCAEKLGGKISVESSENGSCIGLTMASANLPDRKSNGEPLTPNMRTTQMTPTSKQHKAAELSVAGNHSSSWVAEWERGLLGTSMEASASDQSHPSRENMQPHEAEVHCVLDDSLDACELLGELVRTAFPGVKVVAVHTPEEWHQLKLDEFDVLYVDYNLGHELSGADLIHEARQNGHKMPIAGITGNWNVGDYEYEMMMRAGASDILGKPFPPVEELPDRLEAMRAHPQPQKAAQYEAVPKALLARRRRNRRSSEMSLDAAEVSAHAASFMPASATIPENMPEIEIDAEDDLLDPVMVGENGVATNKH
eukprot:TRINITY_DN2742_c0_g1_i7.p1 TRINITY_DN2742_c0_g1~~TRINITY_DN2742_c0_g1_i7.p1  ORF type:complete len:641 (+),score=143.10 TRINITY_DN2742_c0_g1_i7:576-2498(+)